MAVVFHEHNHTYLNDQGQQYISVTTLIKKYTPPFNQDYWSSYKALKDVLEGAGVWQVYKEKAGGWEVVVEYCRKIKNFPYKDAIIQRKKYYILMWKEKGEEARQKGTAFHNKAEEKTKGMRIVLEDLREVEVFSDRDILANPEFNDFGLFPELLIYNDKHKLAGQADWVLKEKNVVHIKDYKTSKDIEMESFRGETLYHPINNLPNANYHTYSLQLSLYAYMLECRGYKVGKLTIEHIKNEYESKLYPVTYLRKEVHALLKDYEQVRKKEARANQSVQGQAGRAIVSA